MASLLQWPPELYLWLLYSLILGAERALPTPTDNHPLQLLQMLARAMARKVNQPGHSRSQQRISGLMAALTLLSPWLVMLALLYWISDIDWVLSALVLYISVTSRAQSRTYQHINTLIQQADTQQARARLQPLVARETASLSALGLRKANLEWYTRFIVQGWLATLVWFCLLGPLAALAYRGLYELATAWPCMHKRSHDFGYAVNWLTRRLAWPASLLVYLLLAARELLTGKLLPWRFTHQPFMHAQDGRLWRAVASRLQTALGGPIMLEGEKRQRPRFIYGPEPSQTTLSRGQRLMNALQWTAWLSLSSLYLIRLIIS